MLVAGRALDGGEPRPAVLREGTDHFGNPVAWLLFDRPHAGFEAVSREEFADYLAWVAARLPSLRWGRAVREVEWITPEEDFPSSDGNPPLKTVLRDA